MTPPRWALPVALVLTLPGCLQPAAWPEPREVVDLGVPDVDCPLGYTYAGARVTYVYDDPRLRPGDVTRFINESAFLTLRHGNGTAFPTYGHPWPTQYYWRFEWAGNRSVRGETRAYAADANATLAKLNFTLALEARPVPDSSPNFTAYLAETEDEYARDRGRLLPYRNETEAALDEAFGPPAEILTSRSTMVIVC